MRAKLVGVPGSHPVISAELMLRHKGIEFTVYRHGDVIMVFWDEGPVTCVLAAIMDPEALLQLAFAKAQRQS